MFNKMLASKSGNTSKAVSHALPAMPSDLRRKTELILGQIQSYQQVIVAFSGGVDSTIVAQLAKLAIGDEAVAVTANSPSLASSELEETKQLARQIGIRQIIVETEELEDPNYAMNPSNRCYFCKKELSQKLKALAVDLKAPFILDGTNADDLAEHRPGAAALSEGGVRRPLAEVGMTKAEVRKLAELLGLPNFDKPSMPCLSSRVQYGQLITPERLLKIEKSEAFVRSLTGAKELRVRDHGNLARIEVGPDERRLFFNEKTLDRIAAGLREFGFTYVALDLLGFRSGSMNELLGVGSRSDVEHHEAAGPKS
jgi:pyridinium-3,5-biscarboxylic acid mononucleotide sulfurtransferase